MRGKPKHVTPDVSVIQYKGIPPLSPQSIGTLKGRLRLGVGYRFALQFCFLRLVLMEKKERLLVRVGL